MLKETEKSQQSQKVRKLFYYSNRLHLAPSPPITHPQHAGKSRRSRTQKNGIVCTQLVAH